MKKIYLILALTAGILASCDMDKEPVGSLPDTEAAQTPGDFTSLRASLYQGMRASVGGNSFYLTPEAQCDGFHALEGNSNTFGDMYRWDFTPNNTTMAAIYSNYQGIITRANFLIDGYNKCDFSDKDVFDTEGKAIADRAKGDAFYVRAYAIFMLSQYFCKDYEDATANDPNTGVSYRLNYAPSSDPSTYPARNTLAETYKQVSDDLDSAALYIHDQGEQCSNYATIDAITALRARMALAKGEYKNAADLAASLVNSRRYYLAASVNELQELWSDDYDTESIMQLFTSAGELCEASGNYYQIVDRNPDFVPTKTLIDLYDENDYRKQVYFNSVEITTSTGASGTVLCFNKFPLETRLYKANPSTDTRSVIAPKVFRIAEMYLIAAEGYAKSKNITEGAKYLNELKRNRIAGYQDQSFTGESDLMDEIMNEREREMVGEGSRLFDIKRWHIAMQRGEPQDESICLLPGATTTELSRPADADRLTWPIPQHEIDLTDRIVQNPGY